MGTVPRLSKGTLPKLAPGTGRPEYDREATGIGQVHLGVGAFMRAHTATYTDSALAASGGNWGIAGVSLRNRQVFEQLHGQDCLFTVAVSDGDFSTRRLIAALRSIDVAPDSPQKIVRLLADPAVRVVTITVTEKGYCLAPDSGALDASNPAILNDLADLSQPQSLLGFLAAAMERRRASHGVPLSIVSCDNLPDNGARLKSALLQFTSQASPETLGWIDTNAAFPATMVDRIVPATTPDDIAAAIVDMHVRDEGLVKTEPFTQWIIQDNFVNDRPAWQLAGALFVPDVKPYELAKLRLLNGAHSALAYLGYLAGHEYIHEVVRDLPFADCIRHVMTHEISPVTPQPDGMQHTAYIADLLQRFDNPSLGHRTWQIAMDGSQKLPQRLLDTVRAQLRGGGPIAGVCLAIAAWMRYVLGRDDAGQPIDVRDPLAERFATIAAAQTDANEIAEEFLRIPEIFGGDLADHPRFASTVAGQLRELLEHGAARTVQSYLDGCGAP